MQTGASSKTFNVKIGEFRGSLETLLEMVQKRKMHISDVSLAKVTDEYLEYIKDIDTLPRKQTVEFVVIATTLLLIKSKALLPGLELSIEEQDSIEELEQRLEVYKIYKEARTALEAYLIKTVPLLASFKPLPIISTPVELREGSVNIELITNTISELVSNLPMQDSKEQAMLAESINIQDVMSELLHKVKKGVSMSFTSVGGESRDEVLVSFLALLELIKDGAVLASQVDKHAEILITRESSVI